MEAGWDPAELTAQYNAELAEKRAAEAGLATIEYPKRLTPREIRAMVDQLGDKGRALDVSEATYRRLRVDPLPTQPSDDLMRLFRLETLLRSARTSVVSTNADLMVIGSKS